MVSLLQLSVLAKKKSEKKAKMAFFYAKNLNRDIKD